MEGYNSIVSKNFVARQNCIQFGTNLISRNLFDFIDCFIERFSREKKLIIEALKSGGKLVGLIGAVLEKVIRRIKYNSSNRSILVIRKGKILNLIVRLKMRLISIFQVESRRPDCNSNF